MIVSADGREVSTPNELEKLAGTDQMVRLRIYRNGGYFFLILKPGSGGAR